MAIAAGPRFGALLVGVIGAALLLSPLGSTLETTWGLDTLFQARGPRPVPPEIAIVRFDREALFRLRYDLPADPRAWPGPIRNCAARYPGLAVLPRLVGVPSVAALPRELHACLIDVLARQGAAVAVFDITLLPRGTPVADRAIADAARRFGRVVFLEATSDLGVASEKAPLVPEIAAAAAGTASFTLDRGVTRLTRVDLRDHRLPVPEQLPVRALEVRVWADIEQGAADIGAAARRKAAFARTATDPSPLLLGLYGPPGTLPTISVASLLMGGGEDTLLPRQLVGRTVFIGFQELASNGADQFPTAFDDLRTDPQISGVELGATAYLNLIDETDLRRAPPLLDAGLVAALGVLLTLISMWRRPPVGIAAAAGLTALWIAGAFTAFATTNLWLPHAVPLLMLPIAVVTGQLLRSYRALRWLGRYVPEMLVRSAACEQKLPPRRAEITVMITDVAGFSTFSEASPPALVSSFLDEHMSMLTPLVVAEGGCVTSFIGDSLTAYWEASPELPDHAARACRAALAIARAVVSADGPRREAGLPRLRLRVGINTGEATIGSVGNGGQSTFGIFGDTVNTAQRIEQLGKAVESDGRQVTVLVSEATRAQLVSGFLLADAGRFGVPGRAAPVRVFKLLGSVAGEGRAAPRAAA